jgi:glycosyltransferase involved in cell wall biosynthesis
VSFEHRGERAAENLADALAAALGSDLTKMREEARRTAENFSPAKIADLYLKEFEALGKNSD